MKIVCLIFVIMAASECVSEPHCSKFHYEEKLLEKMIRTEILVEDVKKDMDAIQKSVKESLAELKEEKIQWTTDITTMRENGFKEFIALQEKAKSELQKNINAVESLKDKIVSPNVAFSAKTARNVSPNNGDTIVFTEDLLNLGEAYSTDTGIFTAPHGGTYIFTVQLCVLGNKYINYGIVVNGVYKSIAQYYDNYGAWRCRSSTATVALNSGNNVWVKVIYRSGTPILNDSGTAYWNMFSGILVHAD